MRTATETGGGESSTLKTPVLIERDRPLAPRIAKHRHQFTFEREVVQMGLNRDFDLPWPNARMIKRATEVVRVRPAVSDVLIENSPDHRWAPPNQPVLAPWIDIMNPEKDGKERVPQQSRPKNPPDRRPMRFPRQKCFLVF